MAARVAKGSLSLIGVGRLRAQTPRFRFRSRSPFVVELTGTADPGTLVSMRRV